MVGEGFDARNDSRRGSFRATGRRRYGEPDNQDVAGAMNLREEFGDIDIYLFDQLLKGRLTASMRLLDAGCGSGRNLPYFLRNGYEVCAVDADPQAIEQVRRLAARLAPQLDRKS